MLLHSKGGSEENTVRWSWWKNLKLLKYPVCTLDIIQHFSSLCLRQCTITPESSKVFCSSPGIANPSSEFISLHRSGLEFAMRCMVWGLECLGRALFSPAGVAAGWTDRRETSGESLRNLMSSCRLRVAGSFPEILWTSHHFSGSTWEPPAGERLTAVSPRTVPNCHDSFLTFAPPTLATFVEAPIPPWKPWSTWLVSSRLSPGGRRWESLSSEKTRNRGHSQALFLYQKPTRTTHGGGEGAVIEINSESGNSFP